MGPLIFCLATKSALVLNFCMQQVVFLCPILMSYLGTRDYYFCKAAVIQKLKKKI